MSREFTRQTVMKFLQAQFPWIDVNVFQCFERCIFMFRSIKKQVPQFKFWYISWHSSLRNVLWKGKEVYYHAHITTYHIWGVEVSFCVCQGLVPYMASPLTLSQSPICSRRSWKIGSILPSAVGPMSISKFPPQLLQKRVKSITHVRLIGTLDNTPFYLVCFVFPI